LESLKFCSSFLVCDVWRFGDERDSIALNMVVLFLISLSGSVLLRPLLRWHRELFFQLKHGGRQCWGVQKIGGSERRSSEHKSHKSRKLRKGDKESPKVCTHLKSCEPLYTCLCAPFYRETKGLFTFRKYPRI
jgi:hypothetical protein